MNKITFYLVSALTIVNFVLILCIARDKNDALQGAQAFCRQAQQAAVQAQEAEAQASQASTEAQNASKHSQP
jgi:hypothetical protein